VRPDTGTPEVPPAGWRFLLATVAGAALLGLAAALLGVGLDALVS
jgi:hypothetical protein